MAILYAGSSANNLTALPDPKLRGLTVRLQDIDSGSTTRTADGGMIRDRIVGGSTAKRKLEIEWPALKPEAAQTILLAIKDVFFYVKYPDPYTADYRTAQFYAGDRSLPVYGVQSNGDVLWEGLKVDLIEK